MTKLLETLQAVGRAERERSGWKLAQKLRPAVLTSDNHVALGKPHLPALAPFAGNAAVMSATCHVVATVRETRPLTCPLLHLQLHHLAIVDTLDLEEIETWRDRCGQ